MTLFKSSSILASTSTIRVKAINATCDINCLAEGFIETTIKGHEFMNFPTLCFLLENKALGRYVLFDCGARKDFWNCAPPISNTIRNLQSGVRVEKNVDEILQEGGMDLEKIDSIIWSHWHWDHCGDSSRFPLSVEIVVGPGFKENMLPGYPVNPNSYMLESDTKRHFINEIQFSDAFKIGAFRAHDFFHDGSLYLLDTPGHAIGHICALARTTPTTFLFLGGDICHFPGQFRPTSSVLLPDPLPETTPLDAYFPVPCPCSLFTACHPAMPDEEVARKTPYYVDVRDGANSMYKDAKVAAESIRGMAEFDADEDVMICIAHDGILLSVLPLFNDKPGEEVGDWKKRGFKDMARWGFLNELPRGGRPGRQKLVEGIWREGKVVDF